MIDVMMMNKIAFSAADAASGAPPETASPGAGQKGESLLYSGLNDGDGARFNAAGEGKASANDPAKSAEENALAKAEHDRANADNSVDGDVVPEDGQYVIALPDGIKLDDALLEKAGPVMKDIGLTNAQASRLAGVLAEQRKAEFDALNDRHQKLIEDWQTEIRTDREFGGHGLDVSLNTANRVIATFGDDALRRDLTEIGIGNHPGLFRLLVRVGNVLSDDKPATSETPAAPKVPPEQAMYGATTPTTRG